MRPIIAVAAALAALVAGAGCQNRDNPVLARVGKTPIRASDYVEIYQRMRPEARPDLDDPIKRQEFLVNLVRRQIMLNEAAARGITRDPQVQLDYELQDRKSVLGPVLQKDLLANPPTPSEAELAAMRDIIGTAYHVRVIAGHDGEQMQAMYRALEGGKPWRQVEEDWMKTVPDKSGSGDQGFVQLENFPSELRDPIAALAPGKWTPVIEIASNYVIAYLQEKKPSGVTDPGILERLTKQACQGDWERRTQRDFLDDLKKQSGVQVDTVFAGQVAERFRAAAGPDEQPGQVLDRWPTFSDEEKGRALATWRGGKVSLEDFLYLARSFPDNRRPNLGVPTSVVAGTQSLVGQKLALEEADRRKLGDRPEVAWQLQKALEQRVLGKLRDDIVKDAKATEEEIQGYYQAHLDSMTAPAEFSVRVVVVADSVRADSVFRMVRTGKTMDEMARKLSIHRESAGRGGDLGWIGPHTYEELYSVLWRSGKGAISRPFHALGGFTVMRVDDVRGRRTATLEESRSIITRRLDAENEDRALTEWLDGKMRETAKLYPERLELVHVPVDTTAAAKGPAGPPQGAPMGASPAPASGGGN